MEAVHSDLLSSVWGLFEYQVFYGGLHYVGSDRARLHLGGKDQGAGHYLVNHPGLANAVEMPDEGVHGTCLHKVAGSMGEKEFMHHIAVDLAVSQADTVIVADDPLFQRSVYGLVDLGAQLGSSAERQDEVVPRIVPEVSKQDDVLKDVLAEVLRLVNKNDVRLSQAQALLGYTVLYGTDELRPALAFCLCFHRLAQRLVKLLHGYGGKVDVGGREPVGVEGGDEAMHSIGLANAAVSGYDADPLCVLQVCKAGLYGLVVNRFVGIPRLEPVFVECIAGHAEVFLESHVSLLPWLHMPASPL